MKGIEYSKSIIISFLLFSIICLRNANAQSEIVVDSNAVVSNSFWDNWYGQFGVDMNLLFPVNHNLKDVFPKGQSMGINMAIGKWFSPVFGGRFKLNWGNGILKNEKNTWLSPYGVPGGNHRNGGFVTFIGDINFNLHNLFGEYRPYRKWNLIAAVRAGGWIDVGTGSGAPVLGVGAINTFRINDSWRAFADVGYHFVASVNGVKSGKGHGSNAFAEINVGIEKDISSNIFYKVTDRAHEKTNKQIISSFWNNWFLQTGIGMSLINPYGTSFSKVFPNGDTFGINVSLGKWFTCDAGVRGGLNWQNGIVVNPHATYLDPKDISETGNVQHGFVCFWGDYLFNLHHIIEGEEATKKWNAIVFPRMGVAKNFSSSYQECPVLGVGTEQVFVIFEKLKIYVDIAYQVTTGGFLDAKYMTGAGANSNGWFDINVGLQFDLTKTSK